jgi:hypothetical protein
MLVTEAEAAGKYCVHALGVACVGSKCMAFRWIGGANVGPSKDKLPWVEPLQGAVSYRAVAERRGYCGLAGGIREPE